MSRAPLARCPRPESARMGTLVVFLIEKHPEKRYPNDMKFVSHSAKETRAFAADFAWRVSARSIPKLTKYALVIALKGDLGAGKTTLTQGFIKRLLPRARVKSPTFLLIKHYPNKKTGRDVYHLDCYRVKKPKDLAPLQIAQILAEPRNIVLIEWPERIGKILPKKRISITLRHGKKDNERIFIL